MSRATTRSYRAGAWFGVFGDHATVLLPPSEKNRVARLWELVDEGAGFDEVLDALVAGGLRQLPGFVLVSRSEADTKVVIRGAARASFTVDGETVDLEGSAATTWVERTLVSVTSMSIRVDGDDQDTGPSTGPGADLGLGNGLVRVSRVDVPPRTPIGAAPAPAEAAAGPPPSDDVDHDAHTPPGLPGQPPVPSAPSRLVARLVLSTGETVEVDRAVVVGRAPDTRRFPSTEPPRPVTVPSPQQEISSTHLEIRPGSGADHGSAVATDLGSTNGTVLVQPGLPPEDLQPGIAVQLIPGAIIDLGDGVTIQVVDP